MSNQLFYCFKNRVGEWTPIINEEVERQNLELDVHATYCMKLCMFCSHRLVCVVNQEVIVARDLEELVQRAVEKME